MDSSMARTKVLLEDPSPSGLPKVLTVAHMTGSMDQGPQKSSALITRTPKTLCQPQIPLIETIYS